MSSPVRVREVHIGNVRFGGEQPFALIAGPCVIESREHCLRHAEAIQKVCRAAKVPLVFKSSARTNDRAHVMRALAVRLTDDEIRAVSAYLAGL